MRVIVDKLSFAYDNKIVLNNLSFSLVSGDFLSVIGRNGTGKSTLAKCMLKLLKIPDKKIFLDDVDINKLKKLFNIGYVPQKSEFNYEFPISVKELLLCAYPKRKDAFFTQIINDLDLNVIYNDNINNLSGGQLQRVFIARALLCNPKMLVLDEPTVGVDQENIEAMYKILSKLKSEGITIILITHDPVFCKDLSTYTLILDDLGFFSFEKGCKTYD